MPFSTTIKFDVKIEKGPPAESAEAPKFDIDAYVPVMMTIPVKPMPRPGQENPTATEVCLDVGDRDRIKFLLISASDYADPNCNKTPVALVLKFGPKDMDWDAINFHDEKQKGVSTEDDIWLQGPLFFSDYTLSMLPPKIESIYVKNFRGKDVELKILVGRSFSKPKTTIHAGPNPNAAAMRGGVRAAQMASR